MKDKKYGKYSINIKNVEYEFIYFKTSNMKYVKSLKNDILEIFPSLDMDYIKSNNYALIIGDNCVEISYVEQAYKIDCPSRGYLYNNMKYIGGFETAFSEKSKIRYYENLCNTDVNPYFIPTTIAKATERRVIRLTDSINKDDYRDINFFVEGNNVLCYNSSEREYSDYVILKSVLINSYYNVNYAETLNIIVHLPDSSEDDYDKLKEAHVLSMGFEDVYSYYNYNSENQVHILKKSLKDIVI